MSVDQWVKGLTGSAPHLFTPSRGAGGNHDNRGGSGGNQVTRAEFDSMDQYSRSDFAKKGGKVVD